MTLIQMSMNQHISNHKRKAGMANNKIMNRKILLTLKILSATIPKIWSKEVETKIMRERSVKMMEQNKTRRFKFKEKRKLKDKVKHKLNKMKI